jgi:pyridoxamine 5'-phosphate oxidase
MVVATVDETGQPYQRIVLLKHYDEKGLVFYTNLGSRKAHQIEKNPHQPAVSVAHAGAPGHGDR